MPLEIIRNDITKVTADAIVNTANPYVAIGFGVDSAVYRAAGRDRLLTERAKIGIIKPGEAAVTPAFDLHAKYIIHTVGPAWQGGNSGEIETVASCYRNSLEKAKELGCGSVAFPLISAGTYGFPKDVALKTAVSEISGFLFSNEMTVYLVVYNKQAFEVSGKVFKDIKSYIEDKDVVPTPDRYENSSRRRMLREMSDILYAPKSAGGAAPVKDAGPVFPQAGAAERADEDTVFGSHHSAKQATRPFFSTESEKKHAEEGSALYEAASLAPSLSIDEMLKEKEETFQQYLFRIIDRKGLTDPEVYKRANIDRKHFSKIRSKVDYNPSKKTALALAVALGLNLDETKDLLLKAGLALTRSSIFDLIMEYCIEHKITDINEINCILFEYDQPTLGA